MDLWPKIHEHCTDINFRPDVSIFNPCEQSKDVLIVIKCWEIVHPLIKVIPVEWDHIMPVGIMYSPNPSEAVKRFLAALKAVI